MRGQARTKLIRSVLQAGILLGCAGCRSPGDWWRARGLDLWDCVPIAVMCDSQPGFNLSVRATLLAQTGIGYYGENTEVANSYGMALGRWGPRWREEAGHLILLSEEEQELMGSNWPGGPDGRFLYHRRGKFVRKNGNVLVVIPLAGGTELRDRHIPRFARFPDWYSVPDSEIALFIGWVGLRVGIAPAQVVDFLCGFGNVDFMRDDAPPRDPERNADPSGDEPMPSSPLPATEPQGQAEG